MDISAWQSRAMLTLDRVVNSSTVLTLASGIEWLASFSPNPSETLFIDSRIQVVELLVAQVLFGTLLFATFSERRGEKPQPYRRQQLTWLGVVLRTMLTACLLVTLVHKYLAQKLAFMFMHCHLVTACYLYSMYTRDFYKAQKVFNVAVYWMFFTAMALATPDMRDLVLPGEHLNFWVHHTVLLLVPVYLVASGHYELDLRNAFNLRLSFGFGGLAHYDLMLPAALVSGRNVGYMLMHPPKSPFRSRNSFRPLHGASMMLLSTIVWLLLRLFVWMRQKFAPSKPLESAKVKQG
jgi:hypothetical protein